jgi:hypothetical protein
LRGVPPVFCERVGKLLVFRELAFRLKARVWMLLERRGLREIVNGRGVGIWVIRTVKVIVSYSYERVKGDSRG